jgi:hypothetical protein
LTAATIPVPFNQFGSVVLGNTTQAAKHSSAILLALALWMLFPQLGHTFVAANLRRLSRCDPSMSSLKAQFGSLQIFG